MTKDKLKQRVIKYAKNYFALNDIDFIIENDKYLIELKPSCFLVEITFNELKYRATLMLQSEIEGIKTLE